MFYDEINNKAVGRCKRPNVSLPVNPDDEALLANGFSRIVEDPMPEFDPSYQTITESLSDPVDGVRTRSYAVEDLPIDGLKDQKRTEMAAKKNAIRDGGFEVNGVLWDSDYNARTAYNELRFQFFANPAYTVENFKVSEGNWITMTKDAFDVAQTIGTQTIENAFTTYKEKLIEIENAQTAQDVALIAWSF